MAMALKDTELKTSLENYFHRRPNDYRKSAYVFDDVDTLVENPGHAAFIKNPPISLEDREFPVGLQVFVNNDPVNPRAYEPVDVYYLPSGSPLCGRVVHGEVVQEGFYIETQPGRRFAVVVEHWTGGSSSIDVDDGRSKNTRPRRCKKRVNMAESDEKDITYQIAIPPELELYTYELQPGGREAVLGIEDAAAGVVKPFVFQGLDPGSAGGKPDSSPVKRDRYGRPAGEIEVEFCSRKRAEIVQKPRRKRQPSEASAVQPPAAPKAPHRPPAAKSSSSSSSAPARAPAAAAIAEDSKLGKALGGLAAVDSTHVFRSSGTRFAERDSDDAYDAHWARLERAIDREEARAGKAKRKPKDTDAWDDCSDPDLKDRSSEEEEDPSSEEEECLSLRVRYRSATWMMLAGLRPDLVPAPAVEAAPAGVQPAAAGDDGYLEVVDPPPAPADADRLPDTVDLISDSEDEPEAGPAEPAAPAERHLPFKFLPNSGVKVIRFTIDVVPCDTAAALYAVVEAHPKVGPPPPGKRHVITLFHGENGEEKITVERNMPRVDFIEYLGMAAAFQVSIDAVPRRRADPPAGPSSSQQG